MESEIECLYCGDNLTIPDWVNTHNYDGEIVCQNCEARLAIKFKNSRQPTKYNLIDKPQIKSPKIILRDAETGEDITDEVNRKIKEGFDKRSTTKNE